MKKVMIYGKEYYQQEQCDIDKLPPMTYPKDLLKNNQPERSKREDNHIEDKLEMIDAVL